MSRIAWLRGEIARLTALARVYRSRSLLTGYPGSVGLIQSQYVHLAERTEDLIARYKTELAQLQVIHPTVPVPGTEYLQPVIGPPTSDQPPAPAGVTAKMVEAQAAAAVAPVTDTVPGAASALPFYKQTWFMVAGAAAVAYLLLTRRG